MSDTDPYAAPVVEEVPAETPLEASVTAKIEVPEGSVKKVLDWVADDATKAQAALDAEIAGENRSSLISKLNAILN